MDCFDTDAFHITLMSHERHCTSPATRLSVQQLFQAEYKENIKDLHFWQFVRESIDDQWIPSPRASVAKTVSMVWRHHVLLHIPRRSLCNMITYPCSTQVLIYSCCRKHLHFSQNFIIGRLIGSTLCIWKVTLVIAPPVNVAAPFGHNDVIK